MLSPSPQYDVVPIQPSVVICSCSRPSMVRNHPDSCSPLAIPGASSSHCPGMEGSVSGARAVGASSSGQDSDRHTQPPVEAPQPRKKKPDDFKFGKILGEGSFSTVMHYAVGFPPGSCCDMLLFWLMYWNESFSCRLSSSYWESFKEGRTFLFNLTAVSCHFLSAPRLSWPESIQRGKNTQVSDIADFKLCHPCVGLGDLRMHWIIVVASLICCFYCHVIKVFFLSSS